jgi:hypothetical protein
MTATEQKLSIIDLPEGVRTRRLGSLLCFFNYNPHPVQLAQREGSEALLGGTDLPPAGVFIAREKEPYDGSR